MQLYPVVLEHAAAFIARSPSDVSRDPALLASAHAAAFDAYRHDPVVCGIDVYNVEVEAWGAVVTQPADNGVPTLQSHPLTDPADILHLPPLNLQRDGRLPLLLDAAERLAAQRPAANVHVPLAGPMALAVGLLGFDAVLMGLIESPDAMAEALRFLSEHQTRLVSELAKLGRRVTLYESGAAPPLVAPQSFVELEAPALRRIFSAAAVDCVLGGNVALVAESLLATGARSVICPMETDQRAFMSAAAPHPDITVRVNMNVADFAGDERTLWTRIAAAAQIARLHPRGILGTGVLPIDADPQRVQRAIAYATTL